MKKSKFLQNSKDMLSRSFNPTKCKTSLRLAAARLKLLKNKKEVQVKQMKRELAQLLESGQDQTARIRVEHVIREEKMMAAYDLVEIYCELIVARLPIIETQKNCPIDLKEAIASIVFASPRCGDVPELLDVRKQFSAKYGKEFISAAIELRPQCGVSRLLVEKLSATAPDGQTKIKILSAIAEEHNVKWDPKSFEEKSSGGSSSVKKENEQYSEPPRFEAAEVQAHPSSNMNSTPLNSVQQDARISMRAENLPPAQTSGASTTFEHRAEPAGEKMPQLFHGEAHNNHPNGQRWTLEFKDAASAAQAAAESAERASMAARAAAEFSSHGRISGQYSTESHKSDTLKDDGPETLSNLNSFKRVSEASVNKSSSEYTRLGNEQIDRTKPSNPMTSTRSDIGGSEEYSEAVSSKSKASADDDSLYHGVPSPLVHEDTQTNSVTEVSEGEVVMKKESSSYETENDNGWPGKVGNIEEGMIGKQKSFSSSYCQSGISDYVNIFANSEDHKFESDTGEYPSVSISETGVHEEAPDTSSHDFVAATFDKSDTDGDDLGPDRGPVYDELDLEFRLHSFGQKSPERTSINTNSWSPRSSLNNVVESASPPSYFTREESSPDNSEHKTLREDSELDNFPAVRFDDSDGPSSESDEDTGASKVEDSRNLFHAQNERGQLVNSEFEEETVQSVGSPSKNEGSLAFGSKQFSLSSDDELNSSEETHGKRNQVNIFYADSPEKLGDVKQYADQPALGSKDSQIELNNVGNESDPESGEGLNFGKLTGGFRHKGHNHLPFFKNQLGASSSVKKGAETPATISSSAAPSLVEHKTTSTAQDLHSVSDSDSSEEEYLPKSSVRKQPHSARTVKAKLTLGSSNSIFGSHDDSDLDEDYPVEPVTRRSHLRSGISRRTKAPSSATNSNLKMHLRSEALDSDGIDRNPTTSYDNETPERRESDRRNSGTQEKYEQPISGLTSVPAESNTWGSTEQPDSLKTTSVIKQESKQRPKSGVYDDSDNSLGKQPSSFYAPDNQEEFKPSSEKSSRLGKSEQQIPAEVAAKPANSSSWETPEKPTKGKATANIVQKSKISQKSSVVEEVASPRQKSDTDASFVSENSKISALDKPSLNKDDNTKKASHVHPKLPDYDALVQSLRINRS
ncbi:hypothetical protein C2S51_001887 [Perilla frutescens var. frutescens]|nr:hypothetical protein C2S51_001887 [Perilla frutescens var. frutescens]